MSKNSATSSKEKKTSRVTIYEYQYHFQRKEKLSSFNKETKFSLDHKYYQNKELITELNNINTNQNTKYYQYNSSLFPKEVWMIILSYYLRSELKDFLQFRLICRYWKDLIDTSHYWISLNRIVFRPISSEFLHLPARRSGIDDIYGRTRHGGTIYQRGTWKDNKLLLTDIVRIETLIGGPKIENNHFLLCNTTVEEKNLLITDIRLKIMNLCKSYYQWIQWHKRWKGTFLYVLHFLEQFSYNECNQFVFWIGYLSSISLFYLFSDVFHIHNEREGPPTIDNNDRELRYEMGFGVIYLGTISYMLLIMKVFYEFFCNNYLITSTELSVDFKHFLSNSYTYYLGNFLLLGSEFILLILALQLKTFSYTSSPSHLTWTSPVIQFILSWKVLLGALSIMIMKFLLIMIWIYFRDRPQYYYHFIHSSNSSSPSSIRSLLSIQGFFNYKAFSWILSTSICFFWIINSIGFILLGNYFDQWWSYYQDNQQESIEHLRYITFFFLPMIVLFSLGMIGILFMQLFIFIFFNNNNSNNNNQNSHNSNTTTNNSSSSCCGSRLQYLLSYQGLIFIITSFSTILTLLSFIQFLFIGFSLSYNVFQPFIWFYLTIFNNNTDNNNNHMMVIPHIPPSILLFLLLNGFYGCIFALFFLDKK